MTVAEALASVEFIVGRDGKPRAAVLDIAAWETDRLAGGWGRPGPGPGLCGTSEGGRFTGGDGAGAVEGSGGGTGRIGGTGEGSQQCGRGLSHRRERRSSGCWATCVSGCGER